MHMIFIFCKKLLFILQKGAWFLILISKSLKKLDWVISTCRTFYIYCFVVYFAFVFFPQEEDSSLGRSAHWTCQLYSGMWFGTISGFYTHSRMNTRLSFKMWLPPWHKKPVVSIKKTRIMFVTQFFWYWLTTALPSLWKAQLRPLF